MIYELRNYACVPAQLPRLLKRFENLTLPYWKKYGIRPVGFWTVLIGDGTEVLYYLLAWESLAEREQKFPAFMADPDWEKARLDSEKDGPMVAYVKSTILKPTTFSAMQ